MGADCLTWQHFGWLLGLIAGWSMVIIATARWAVSSGLGKINEVIKSQDEKIAENVEKQHELEREVLEIKADLPACYVRREDFIRNEVTINTKLDRLRDLIERKENL